MVCSPPPARERREMPQKLRFEIIYADLTLVLVILSVLALIAVDLVGRYNHTFPHKPSMYV